MTSVRIFLIPVIKIALLGFKHLFSFKPLIFLIEITCDFILIFLINFVHSTIVTFVTIWFIIITTL